MKQKIHDIVNANGYEVIARETDKDPIHFLLGYDMTDRVADIVATIKQQTTDYPGEAVQALPIQTLLEKGDFLDGYFACSMGEMSLTTIRGYIESQG